jgi:hypothetical protein
MGNDLIYVFCILKEYPQPEDKENALAHYLTFFRVKEYYVCLKLVSPDEFSEGNRKKNLANPDWLKVQSINHLEVIKAIMKNYAVIPFKFGTLFKDYSDLEKFIENRSDLLVDKFRLVENKEEWEIKIYCDKKVMTDHISELNEEIELLDNQILQSAPGKAFMLKYRKNELTNQEIDRLMLVNTQKCLEELKSLSQLYLIHYFSPFKKEGETLILKASFLVEKNIMPEFIRLIHLQESKYSSLGFSFEAKGPLPPFSFASIE